MGIAFEMGQILWDLSQSVRYGMYDLHKLKPYKIWCLYKRKKKKKKKPFGGRQPGTLFKQPLWDDIQHEQMTTHIKRLKLFNLYHSLENSADDKLMMIFFLFFPENGIWHYMQIVFIGDNLHEMANPVSWEK